ncbi:MAG: hypothetical protein OXF41_13650 [bacterium]|nr:hypothetical protein [bacterium]
MPPETNIGASTNWYIASVRPRGHTEARAEDLAEILIEDIEVTIARTNVRAGVIGELGITEPLDPRGKKGVAAGAARNVLGVCRAFSSGPSVNDKIRGH